VDHLGYVSAGRGNFDAPERYLELAAAARGPHSAGEELIDWNITSARGVMALVTGAHGDAATELERAAQISLSAGRLGPASIDLAAAAFEWGAGWRAEERQAPGQ
jgi:hypothetical protein